MSSSTIIDALISNLVHNGIRDDVIKGGYWSRRKTKGQEFEVVSVTLGKLLNFKFPHL